MKREIDREERKGKEKKKSTAILSGEKKIDKMAREKDVGDR